MAYNTFVLVNAMGELEIKFDFIFNPMATVI